MRHTYILGIVLAAMRVLDHPPEMARQVHRAALVGLLEELATVQSGLGDQCVVVFLGEPARAMQGSRDDADGLELRARVADRILVDGECLREELVADFFEARLVGDFTAHHKQSQRQICASRVHTLVEIIDALVHESVERR